VAYSEGLPVPERLESRNLEDGGEMGLGTIGMDVHDINHNTKNVLPSSENPHLLNQGKLNDFSLDLNLFKNEAELDRDRLKGWNLLDKAQTGHLTKEHKIYLSLCK
jgi:hypothetical protein